MPIRDQDVLKVLQALHKGEPSYLSDLLFGFGQFPSPSSAEDNRIRLLEDYLIKMGLVMVVEKGGTNRTQGGYYVFAISTKGISYLQSLSLDNSSKVPIYALSTDYDDNMLRGAGLKNVGLLGFLEENGGEGLFPLKHLLIAFPKRHDHFYTLDESRERFENRSPIPLPSLGFGRKSDHPDYILLYRFFDNTLQNHLYVTNPDLDKIGKLNVRHEYKDNPIYIRRTGSQGSIPLYLYSSRKVDFFYPLNDDDVDDSESDDSSDSDSESDYTEFIPDNFRTELEQILEEQKLDLSKFSFTESGRIDGERSLTVGVKETWMNFYVNLQRNQTYFTVRRNPNPKDEAYIVHEIELWSEVVKRFKRWIIDIKQEADLSINPEVTTSTHEQSNIGESKSAFLRRQKHAQYEFSMGDSQDIDPALGVVKLAGQVAKIINKLKAEPGNMTGIFAQWGRGKTRMMSEIWKCLRAADAKFDYELVRYQAWRYQHTPASWAYLYEQFSCAYLGNKRTIRGFLKYHRRLFHLNLIRDGWMNLLLSIIFFSAVLWGVWETVQHIWNIEVDYSGLISVAILSAGATISVIVRNLKSEYLTRAISLIKKYMEKVSFNEALGVQAEIQKELIHLVNAWVKLKKPSVPNESNGKKKTRKWWAWIIPIFLSRPIEKQGSEKLLSKRPFEKGFLKFVHVLLAIFLTSERRQKKIVLFVDDLDRCSEEKIIEIIDSLRIMLDDNDLKEKLIVVTAIDERMLRMAVENKFGYDKDKSEEYPDLTKEYIDKLFIFSIKLGTLDGQESGEFFENLVKNEYVPETVADPDTVEEVQSLGAEEQANDLSNSVVESRLSEEKSLQTLQNEINVKIDTFEKPPEHHIRIFKSKLGQLRRSTPRKIRILFYRYLFARNLLIQQQEEEGSHYWLSNGAHGVFVEQLIRFSQEDIKLIYEEKRRLVDLEQNTNLFDADKLPIGREEYKLLLSIFEITIAY